MYIKLILIPILIFSILLYGCETVRTTYVDKEKMPTEKDREFQGAVPKISGVFLKDGTFLNLKDKNAEINIKDSSKTVTYDLNESTKGSISFNDISSFKIDLVKGNIWFPILIIVGIVAAGIITIIIGMASGHFNISGG
jgi:hypothetical protein